MIGTSRTRWAGVLLLAAALLLVVLIPVAAGAQESCDPTDPTCYVPQTFVGPTTTTLPGTTTTTDPKVTTTTDVLGTVVTRVEAKSSSQLPFTGGDIALLTMLGLGAAVAGVALVWLGRRSDAKA